MDLIRLFRYDFGLMGKRNLLLALALSTLGLSLPSFAAATVSLQSYLKEVSANHKGLKAATELSQAAALRADEGDLLTLPSLFAESGYLSDSKENANPAFQGTRTLHLQHKLGVAQQTSFGLGAKLYYSLSHTELEGTSPQFVPLPNFYEASPTLELSQSLWRNGFGSETRAMRDAANAKAAASQYSESFKAKMLVAEAVNTYWRLVIAREMVDVQTSVHRASQKLKEWNQNRVRSGLGDRSDLLQSEAGLQARTIELEAAESERETAERQFNSLRGKTETSVTDSLETLDAEKLLSFEVPKRMAKREDVQAAEAVFQATALAADLSKEKNAPDLSLVGSASLNGRDGDRATAMSDSFKTENPTFALGVKFSTPLAFGVTSENRRAYIQERQAAELSYERTAFEAERGWEDLNRRFTEAKKRLSRALDLQKMQNEKLGYERERLKKGRSVTYQVLLFEQDYANAQALRLKTELEILSLQSLLSTYAKSEAGS